MKPLTENEIISQTDELYNLGVYTNFDPVYDKYKGLDNNRKPKKDYLKKLVSMDNFELLKEAKSKIWLSGYANNNPRSDYHWHVDAIYDECKRRNKLSIYKLTYERVLQSL
jgi:hypothetical protein